MTPDPTNENDLPRAKAAVYVRMSTEHQQYSTSNQMDAICEYALRRNLEIVKVYSDEGKSGLSIHGRESFSRMIADVKSGSVEFSCILVYDVSRWGRFQDADESAYYQHVCRRAGIQVHYCAEQFENDGSPVTFPGLTSIGTLSIQYQKLMTGVDLTGLTSASVVECLNNTAQTSLNMGTLTTVQNLNLQYLSALTTLNISSLTSITGTFTLQYCSLLASAPVLTGKTINLLSWCNVMFSTVSFTGVTITGTIAFNNMSLIGTLVMPSSGTYSVNFQTVSGFTAFNFGSASVANLTLNSCTNLSSLTVPPGNNSCVISYCSALMSLTVGSQPSCTYFTLAYCGSISTLNLTGIATAMYYFVVSYCGMLTTGLTIKTGTVMQNSYSYLDLRYNSLTTACINAIFTALGSTALSPTIQLDGNPGESASNISTANGKGWNETPGGSV